MRFAFVRPIENYISLNPQKDVINIAYDNDMNACESHGSLIDINGFDIFKYLKLLYKSNPTTIEWLNSPIVYYGDNNLPLREYQDVIEIKSYGLERNVILRISEFDAYFNIKLQKKFNNFNPRKPDVEVLNNYLQTQIIRP